MRVRVARQRGGVTLPSEGVEPSKTAIRASIEQKRGMVTEDVALADQNLQAAHSVIAQRIRAVVVIPLFADGRRGASAIRKSRGRASCLACFTWIAGNPRRSQNSSARFWILWPPRPRSLWKTPASLCSSANASGSSAKSASRAISSALCSAAEFHHYSYLEVTGSNQSCLEVGGDYYDLFDMGPERIAFVLADVSGKGLGAALMTTMLQGALSATTFGQHPAETFAHINDFCATTRRSNDTPLCSSARSTAMAVWNTSMPGILRRCWFAMGKWRRHFPRLLALWGLIPDMEFSSSVVMLQPSDTLVLFSDGVSEAMDPEQNEYRRRTLRAGD